MSTVELESSPIADTSGDARTDTLEAAGQDEKENGTIEGEYNKNIMNAYFIMKYHVLKNVDSEEKRSIIWTLAVLNYVCGWTQAIGYIIMIVAYIGSNYNIDRDTWADTLIYWHFLKWPDSYVGQIFFMFPLYIIAIVGLCGEVQIAWQDWKLYSHYAAENSDGGKVRVPMEIATSKVQELVFNGLAGLIFMYFLARYPSGSDWGLILDTIFNLLAYQFVTGLDEAMYALVDTNMRIWCDQQGVEVENIFKGPMAYQKASNVFPRLVWIGLTALLFTGLQAQAPITTYTSMVLLGIVSLYRLKGLWQKQRSMLNK